jgi:signal transduction histidine kinase
MMVRALINQKEYLQALKVVMEMDSLNMLYNSTEHLKQIAELNKKYEVNLKDIRIKEQNASMKIQIGIIFGLVAMLSLLYYFFSKSIKQKNIILQQNKLNERLVTIISHDIKEPLLGVQLLLKKLNVNDIYLTQASQSLVLQVSAVNDILNNILKFQKAVIEKTNEVSNHKDILWASSQSQKELSSQITDKRLSVEINLNANPELRIPISKEKLKIIIYNLLGNSIKYSYLQGVVKIYSTHNGIMIQDFGTGIPADSTNRLLQDVLNSEKGTQNESGTGIGLYIVGQLIKDSKLKIKFEPQPQGTLVMIYS